MPLDIRITVNDDRKRKLNEIDGAVDADKTTIKQRLMDEAIDAFHKKLFKPGDVAERMKVVGDDERNA